jgi:hypothetical protein
MTKGVTVYDKPDGTLEIKEVTAKKSSGKKSKSVPKVNEKPGQKSKPSPKKGGKKK